MTEISRHQSTMYRVVDFDGSDAKAIDANDFRNRITEICREAWDRKRASPKH